MINFNKRTVLGIVCAATMALVGASSAKAGSVTLTGYVFVNNPNVNNAVMSVVPSVSSADVTFTVTSAGSIDFDSRSGSNNSAFYTLSAWLGTGGATGISALTSAGTTALTAPLSSGSTGDLFLLTGTINIVNGESFTITHDDGVSVYINGVVIPGISPGPTSPNVNTITYTGASINGATLDIVYGECCGAPAVLATNLPTGGNNPTPEPGTLVLLGTGLLGLGGAVRRRVLG